MQLALVSREKWRLPLSDQALLGVIAAACCVVVASVVPFIIGQFTHVTMGAWQFVAAATLWYVASSGGWLMYTLIPLYITHGQTRRGAFRVWMITGGGMVTLTAAIITLGFLVERWLYQVQGFTGYAEPVVVPDLLLSFLLAFAVFWVVGGSIGGALYRSPRFGWISIPIGLGLIALTGSFEQASARFVGFWGGTTPFLEIETMWIYRLLLVIVVCSVGWVVWMMIRHLAVRNR